MQALTLAMRFASTRIDHLLSEGWQFHWKNDVDSSLIDIQWNNYFMPQVVLDRLSSIGRQGVELYSKSKE